MCKCCVNRGSISRRGQRRPLQGFSPRASTRLPPPEPRVGRHPALSLSEAGTLLGRVVVSMGVIATPEHLLCEPWLRSPRYPTKLFFETRPKEELCRIPTERASSTKPVPAALVVDDEPPPATSLLGSSRGRSRRGHRPRQDCAHWTYWKNSIQLVILDRHMPGISSLEVIKQIRADPINDSHPGRSSLPETPISTTASRAWNTEPTNYLSKPVSFDSWSPGRERSSNTGQPDDAIRQFVESGK